MALSLPLSKISGPTEKSIAQTASLVSGSPLSWETPDLRVLPWVSHSEK